MDYRPSVEDLRLVDAVARLGSLGAAARELLVSQPSASQRLAALERRCGMTLFARDTTGARPTPAGVAMAAEAEHILDHLGSVFDRTREAASQPVLRVGTFASLAPLLFPALDRLLRATAIFQVTDHGDHLVPQVGGGALDLAVVGLAKQLTLPAGLVSIECARDELVLCRPEGAPELGSERRPWSGTPVAFHVLDFGSEALHARITALGGVPRRSATADTALALARQCNGHAMIVRGLAAYHARPGEDIEVSPVRRSYTLSMVTRAPVPPEVSGIRSALAEALGMLPVR